MPNLSKFLTTAGLLILSAFFLTGCGESKEQQAIRTAQERAKNKPAHIRFINLTNMPVVVEWDGRELENGMAIGVAPRFRGLGYGQREVVLRHAIEQEDGSFDKVEIAKVSLDAKPSGLYTYVVFGTTDDAKAVLLTDTEAYEASSSLNLKAFFVSADGKPSTGSVKLVSDSGKSYDISDTSNSMLVDAGEYTLEGEGFAFLSGGEIKTDSGYTVLVFDDPDGNKYGMLLRSRNPDTPEIGGTS